MFLLMLTPSQGSDRWLPGLHWLLWASVGQPAAAAALAFVLWNVSAWKNPVCLMAPLFVSHKAETLQSGFVCLLRVRVGLSFM